MPRQSQKRRANGDGWVYQDGSQWRFKLAVAVDPVTGKVQYRGGRAASHAEATEKLRRLQAELLGGRLSAPSKGALAKFLDQWVENAIKPNRTHATYRQYRWLIDQHLVPHLGKKRIEDLRRADVQRLIALKASQTVQSRGKVAQETTESKLSRSTLRLIRAVLHAAYNDAIRDGLASINPASHVELPREAKKPPVSLKAEDVRSFLAVAASADMSEFWLFLFLTGCRLGEASGLRWQDVDLIARVARIQGQLQRVEGTLRYVAGTKTNQTRDLQLPDLLVARLQEVKSRQLIEETSDPDGLVFLNPYGRRLDPKYVRDRLAELCRLADVPVISPHKARHTAATLALSATGDLHSVQKMLGHAQISLTANLYGHGTAEAQRRVADSLSNIMVPQEPT
ncbi:MAG: Tyrosine recombinase XerC [Fimbriimonadaceae bacterium]|nr:Tyrosine recombinase XerC [Fimbriimonadaceae bacterium]